MIPIILVTLMTLTILTVRSEHFMMRVDGIGIRDAVLWARSEFRVSGGRSISIFITPNVMVPVNNHC